MIENLRMDPAFARGPRAHKHKCRKPCAEAGVGPNIEREKTNPRLVHSDFAGGQKSGAVSANPNISPPPRAHTSCPAAEEDNKKARIPPPPPQPLPARI